MKLKASPKVTVSDFPKAGEAFSPKFIQNYSSYIREIYQALAANLTFVDNMNTVWMSRQFSTW